MREQELDDLRGLRAQRLVDRELLVEHKERMRIRHIVEQSSHHFIGRAVLSARRAQRFILDAISTRMLTSVCSGECAC